MRFNLWLLHVYHSPCSWSTSTAYMTGLHGCRKTDSFNNCTQNKRINCRTMRVVVVNYNTRMCYVTILLYDIIWRKCSKQNRHCERTSKQRLETRPASYVQVTMWHFGYGDVRFAGELLRACEVESEYYELWLGVLWWWIWVLGCRVLRGWGLSHKSYT